MVNNWYIKGGTELAEFFIKTKVKGLTGEDETGCYWLDDKNKWDYDGATAVRNKKLISFKKFLELINKTKVYELW
jgi:hypothetical protein